MSENKLDWKKYLTIFIIASGTTVMYSLPYLKSTFYDPMRLALGLDHQQLGNLLSVYGILATILYFFGGFMADKFSAKKLMSFSLVSTGHIPIIYNASCNICIMGNYDYIYILGRVDEGHKNAWR